MWCGGGVRRPGSGPGLTCLSAPRLPGERPGGRGRLRDRVGVGSGRARHRRGFRGDRLGRLRRFGRPGQRFGRGGPGRRLRDRAGRGFRDGAGRRATGVRRKRRGLPVADGCAVTADERLPLHDGPPG
ncbi:hypothetical protein GZL_01938 [Streptomyces sp. 769]|nr:hypothetical protein GZL_01938 [Streptomyces sp. 769]